MVLWEGLREHGNIKCMGPHRNLMFSYNLDNETERHCVAHEVKHNFKWSKSITELSTSHVHKSCLCDFIWQPSQDV